ncbi:hypothetical protein GmHk_09G025760 [Glycine max]|nr:hypothetical protein GmHk_09G025760 [Glycine max]
MIRNRKKWKHKHNIKRNTDLGISQSCGSAPSQEIKQISHLLVLAGLICLVGSLCGCLCWCLSCPGLGPISRPCDLCPELIRSRAWKKSKTLALQAEAQLVKTVMGLYMRPVVGRLLANQMP